MLLYTTKPRFEKYVPTERDCPMPPKWLDVIRFTATQLPEKKMRSIDDYWLEDKDESLDQEWTGTTRFPISKPRPKYGYNWVEGRETKIQKTTRLDKCRPELWQILTDEKKTAQDQWAKTKSEREEQRKKRGI